MGNHGNHVDKRVLIAEPSTLMTALGPFEIRELCNEKKLSGVSPLLDSKDKREKKIFLLVTRPGKSVASSHAIIIPIAYNESVHAVVHST